MTTDRHGLAIGTNNAAAADAYRLGCDLLLTAFPGATEALDQAIAADPGFALAHAAKARLQQLHGDMPGARASMATANVPANALSDREASHIAFLDMLLNDQGPAALAALRTHLAAWPRDAVVLSTSVGPSGLIGRSCLPGLKQHQAALMDSVAPAYGDDWWFIAHHAVALAETQQRAQARPKLERSLAANPRNAWAAHWRSHLEYEDGDTATAREFLRSWLPGYAREGQLHGHLHWHLALSELDAGNMSEAFQLFTDKIAPGMHPGRPQSVLADSISFLWRAELAGASHDPARWQAVHAFASAMFPRPGDAYVDWHVAVSQAVAGDGAAMAARVTEMENLARDNRYPSDAMIPALARGFAAFQRQDFNAAIAAIAPLMDDLERIGGSRAQTDLVELTLLRAYLAAGRPEDARIMLHRRRAGPGRPAVAGVQ